MARVSQPTRTTPQPFTLDDHSKVVPRLPIPNRTVKRLCADDSGWTSVKVGHRQAFYSFKRPVINLTGRLCFVQRVLRAMPLGVSVRGKHIVSIR